MDDNKAASGSPFSAIGRPIRTYLYVGVCESLPTAEAAHRDQLRIVHDPGGAKDRLYVCLRSASGAFRWEELAEDLDLASLVVNGNTTLGNADNDETTIRGHLIFDGSAPSIAVNTAVAGAGATATVAGTDGAFRVTLTTGTGAIAGRLFTVTFANAWASVEYEATFSAHDPNAALSMTKFFVDFQDQTTSSFPFHCVTALADSTVFRFGFHVHGGI